MIAKSGNWRCCLDVAAGTELRLWQYEEAVFSCQEKLTLSSKM